MRIARCAREAADLSGMERSFELLEIAPQLLRGLIAALTIFREAAADDPRQVGWQRGIEVGHRLRRIPEDG